MEFTPYTRRPFAIEAVQITEENIAELAELVGDLEEKDGQKFIRINKRLVPNIHRAYVGWWVTRMEDNLRCYSDKIFNEQFEPADVGEEALKLPAGSAQIIFPNPTTLADS